MDTALQSALRNRIPLMLSVCAAGIVIGSIGPWATVVVETVSGTSGDGQVTLLLGVFAGTFAILELARPNGSHRRYIGMAIAFLLAGVIGINTWINVGNTISRTEMNASVGWGLQLVSVAAMGGGIVAYIETRKINRIRRQRQKQDRSTSAIEGEDTSQPHRKG